jgi:hypothetical protein
MVPLADADAIAAKRRNLFNRNAFFEETDEKGVPETLGMDFVSAAQLALCALCRQTGSDSRFLKLHAIVFGNRDGVFGSNGEKKFPDEGGLERSRRR